MTDRSDTHTERDSVDSDRDSWIGWYEIDEIWSLWLSENEGLTDVYVSYVHITEKKTGGYYAEHYAPDTSLLSSDSLECDDIPPVLGDKERVNPPAWYKPE